MNKPGSINIYRILFTLFLLLLFSTPAVSATWWDASWMYRVDNPISDGVRPYQLSLYVSNSTGTNNATHIFCNGGCNANFTDIRFTLDDTTLIPHWIEDNTTGKVWINLTANGTVNMYYRNVAAPGTSNGNATFIQWHGATSDSFTDSLTVSPSSFIYQARVVRTAGSGADVVYWGLRDAEAIAAGDKVWIDGHNTVRLIVYNDGSTSLYSYGVDYLSIGTWRDIKIIKTPTTVTGYVDSYVSSTLSTNLPTGENLGMFMYEQGTHTGIQNYSFVRHYASTEPVWGTWEAPRSILITSWNNNYTNDELTSFSIGGSSHINFSIVLANPSDTIDWYVNGVNQSVHYNNLSTFVGSAGANNITVLFHNATVYDSITWFVTLPFVLLTPSNNSIIYNPYPPMTTNINFTWSTLGYADYNIEIAEDLNFYLPKFSLFTTKTNQMVALSGGTYFWHVRYYDVALLSYGNWSPPFGFTITNNYTSSGKAGVEGVVYEIISGVNTPISGAAVYVYNSSVSYQMITGLNGYYLFDNLTNATTYSVYAEKTGYETTAAFPFTTGIGTRTQKNILMKAYISPYVPNFVYEKFIIRGLFDNPYPGVTATVYKGADITAYLTGTTDSMGAVVFQLIKDQYYRVTFSGGGLSSTITVYVYGKEEVYLITVVSGFPITPNRNSAISANLTTSTINATHSNLSLIYSDASATTTGINFTVKNATTGAVMCLLTASSNTTLDCTVASVGIYQFGYNATSTTYGTFSGIKYINFGAGSATNPTIPTQGTSPSLLHWGSVILIVIVAALFSIRSVKYGTVIVPFVASVLWWNGWFQANGVIITLAIVIGITIYIRQSEPKVSY